MNPPRRQQDALANQASAIYLDVCALCRPFDDQSFLRIRLETEAVNMILSKVKSGSYSLMVSPAHTREIAAIEDRLERTELEAILANWGQKVNVDNTETRIKAEKLAKLGFGVADAAHVAFAEQSGAPFISVDDRLIKKCEKAVTAIWCGNPVGFCEREELR